MHKINPELSKTLILNADSIFVQTVLFKNENYYLKKDEELKEIIGYYLTRYLGLHSVIYQGILINGFNYSFSLDYHFLGDFYSLEEIKEIHSLKKIIQILSEHSFFSKTMLNEIYMMYFFDLLFLNNDRNCSNWGILTNQGQSHILLFDHSNLFRLDWGQYIYADSRQVFHGFSNKVVEEDFMSFLQMLDTDQYLMIEELFYKINPNVVQNIFQKIEAEYQTKINPLFLNLYEERYHIIERVLLKYRGDVYAR